MTKRSKANGRPGVKIPEEVRCPDCGYFLAEPISLDGDDFTVVIKIVCRSCRGRLLLKLSPREVLIGQI